jgi:NitT/TauT family transport system substrate-binding protein
MITRRRALGRIGTLAVGAAAGAAGLQTPAIVAQERVKLRAGLVPVIDMAPFHAALKLGYYQAEGIEIDSTPAPGGAAILPALAAGQFDIAFSNTVSILLGIQEGLEFRFITGTCLNGPEPPDVLALYARSDSNIRSAKDLAGKRISSNTRNNIIWLRIRAWLDKHGVDPGSANIVEVPFPQAADALLGGQIDAASLYEPFMTSAIETHGDRLVRLGWPFGETSKASLISQFAATSGFIDKNPGVIERFARAQAKGVDWVNKNRGSRELEEIIAGYTRIPPERQRKMVFCSFDANLDPAKVQEIADLMKKHGIGGRLPPVEQVMYKTARM